MENERIRKGNIKSSFKSKNNKKMRIITLEEHYATPTFIKGPGKHLKNPDRASAANSPLIASRPNLAHQLMDIGSGRIAEMDEAGINMQVLSLTSPGVEQLNATEALKIARDANDHLVDAVCQYPDRFAGLAALPTTSPDTAAEELEHLVREHDFKGAVINGHIHGRYLDDEFFWPIMERAEALQVPIYLHPTLPLQPVIENVYKGNYSMDVTSMFAAAAWGWHIETATHVLRIILSGAFDKYPHLQLVIGHLGEALPFMLQRIDNTLPRELTKLDRPIGDYLRENIHYTFSGFNYIPPFLNLFLQVGADRIMFSSDYPYSSMKSAYTFLDQLPVSAADKEKIAHLNAERILRL